MVVYNRAADVTQTGRWCNRTVIAAGVNKALGDFYRPPR